MQCLRCRVGREYGSNPTRKEPTGSGKFSGLRKIMAALVIFDNPKGAITNSDLELAALVLQ